MPANVERTRRIINILTKILPILAFIVPLIILYLLYPASFEATWKGRTYYLFFLWILCMEMILNWEETHVKIRKLKSVRAMTFILVLLLPTMYIVVANYSGLNSFIVAVSPKHGNPPDPFWAKLMPLSVEYLVFSTLFALIVLLGYGLKGLKNCSISAIFLGVVGTLYVIDNVFPYGQFTPFQIIVEPTAKLAMNVLNWMGYNTLWLGIRSGMPTFIAWDAQGRYSPPFSIAWPCSGVESLLIYTVTILLFLKKSPIRLKSKIVYFAIGAIITYFINILRIVTIFIIAINKGDWWRFHDYYGQLYSITWIISYPLIIIGIQALVGKIRNRRISRAASLILPNQATPAK